jgi:hypothetical protein
MLKEWENKEDAIRRISERDGYLCFICKEPFGKKEKPTIDHWIPISKGGKWDISNLRLAHRSCNFWKADRVPLKDGTIPEKPEKSSQFRNKRITKQNRPKVCTSCMSGRSLGPNQICNVCNSGPQPPVFPGWAKRKSYNCDHNKYHCFACVVGFVARRA